MRKDAIFAQLGYKRIVWQRGLIPAIRDRRKIMKILDQGFIIPDRQ